MKKPRINNFFFNKNSIKIFFLTQYFEEIETLSDKNFSKIIKIFLKVRKKVFYKKLLNNFLTKFVKKSFKKL